MRILNLPIGGHYFKIISWPSKQLSPKEQLYLERKYRIISTAAFGHKVSKAEIKEHLTAPDIALAILALEEKNGKLREKGYYSTKQETVGGRPTVYLAGTALHPDVKGKHFYELMQLFATMLAGGQMRFEGKPPVYIAAQTQHPHVLEKLEALGLHPAKEHPPEEASHLAEVAYTLSKTLDEREGVNRTRRTGDTIARLGAYQKYRNMYGKKNPTPKSKRHKEILGGIDAKNGDAIVLAGHYPHPSPAHILNPEVALKEKGIVGDFYRLLKEHYPEEFKEIVSPIKLQRFVKTTQEEIKPRLLTRKNLLEQYGFNAYGKAIAKIRLTGDLNSRLLQLRFEPNCFNLDVFRRELKNAIEKRPALAEKWEKFAGIVKELGLKNTFEEITEGETGFTIGLIAHPEIGHIATIHEDSVSITLDPTGLNILDCVAKAVKPEGWTKNEKRKGRGKGAVRDAS